MGLRVRINTQKYDLITSTKGEWLWGGFRYSATKKSYVYQLLGEFYYSYNAMKVV
jgi:hypothetical protein